MPTSPHYIAMRDHILRLPAVSFDYVADTNVLLTHLAALPLATLLACLCHPRGGQMQATSPPYDRLHRRCSSLPDLSCLPAVPIGHPVFI